MIRRNPLPKLVWHSLTVLIALTGFLFQPTDVHAVSITTGQTLTWAYDFTGQTPAPTYEGISVTFSGNVSLTAYKDSLTNGSFAWRAYDDYFSDAPSLDMSIVTPTGQVLPKSYNLNAMGFTLGGWDDSVIFLTIYNVSGTWEFNAPTMGAGMYNYGDFVFTNYLAGSITTSPSAPVPEPGTMMLLGSGLVGLVGYGRRRLKK